MVIGVGNRKNQYVDLNVGTHDKVFHCDEVVGVSIIEIANPTCDIYVVRTREIDELRKLDIVIDVGGGEYDHHVKGFDLKRECGVKYASAGLMWKKYGKKAITNVMKRENISALDYEINQVFEKVDQDYIIPVDMEDNGEMSSRHMFSFIPIFLPPWIEEDQDFDKEFEQVQNITTKILKKCIKDALVQVITRADINQRIERLWNGILELPDQTVPWLEHVTSYNKKNSNVIKFVIFPYPAGGWAAQCVPPSIEERFKQLIPFPEKWAGGNDKTLPEISKIEDATFCHNGRFFARAKSKESIIKMCEIAEKDNN